MKNLNKLIKKLQSYYWIGLCCGILQAEIVITEFFIREADGTEVPQYIELYNTSDTTVSIENWSIKTYGTISRYGEKNYITYMGQSSDVDKI